MKYKDGEVSIGNRDVLHESQEFPMRDGEFYDESGEFPVGSEDVFVGSEEFPMRDVEGNMRHVPMNIKDE